MWIAAMVKEPLNIVVIVLAAGGSTRLGAPKQLLSYQGRSLLRHVVEVALNSQADRVIVVLGAQVKQMKPEVEPLPVRVVQNPHWQEGLSSSIRAGVQAAQELNADAAILMVCDQPFVTTELIVRLIEAYRASGQPIIACEYAGTLGVPALFDRALFPELLTLQGDQGAKRVILVHRQHVVSIPFPEGATDIDAPGDRERLMRE